LQTQIEGLAQQLNVAAVRLVESRKQRLEHGAARLAALSPERVLERGYGIVRSRGAYLRSAGDAVAGAEIEVAMADGTIIGTVTRYTEEITWRNLQTKKQ
jgi:exonuclease VII large subunit